MSKKTATPIKKKKKCKSCVKCFLGILFVVIALGFMLKTYNESMFNSYVPDFAKPYIVSVDDGVVSKVVQDDEEEGYDSTIYTNANIEKLSEDEGSNNRDSGEDNENSISEGEEEGVVVKDQENDVQSSSGDIKESEEEQGTEEKEVQASEKNEEELEKEESSATAGASFNSDGPDGAEKAKTDNSVKESSNSMESRSQETDLKTSSTAQDYAALRAEVNNQNLKSYRMYLSSANNLMSKFNSGKDFSRDLMDIKAIKYPANIQDILADMEEYNQEVKENGCGQEIKYWGSNFVSKFIKIKKLPNTTGARNKLKAKIESRLSELNNYFYSSEAQNSLMNK